MTFFQALGLAGTLNLLGLLIAVPAWLWIVVLAFKERLAWGLGTLLIPPVALVYGAMRVRACKVPLIMLACGLALRVSAFAVAVRESPRLVTTVSPTDVIEGRTPSSDTLVVVGCVASGTVQKQGEVITVFNLRDSKSDLLVEVATPLPSFFKEGSTIVAKGLFRDGRFRARELLQIDAALDCK
jgi:cytochrome c-type biogenesis protein CcmE